MSDSLADVRDLLVPPRCAGCGGAGAWLCTTCRDGCEPLHEAWGGLALSAAGSYAGPLREAIHRLKYRGERGLASDLGALVALRVAADLAAGVTLDAVVPVPLHRARTAARGYDQAALLASTVAASTGLPLRNALHRIRPGAPQVTLDRAAREANVAGAFVGVVGTLAGLSVALVDDVATTGATLRAAARAARSAGARATRAYAVAFDE